MQLPPIIKYLKNEIATIHPWLPLLDITLPDGQELHFVHNTEDIVFGGVTYQKFPFQIEIPELDSEGNIPRWNLNIDNSDQLLLYDLYENRGAVDSEITFTIVNAVYLSDGYIDNQWKIKILETSYDKNWIVFTCGGKNPFQDVFPPYRYFADFCKWKFGWHECGYVDPTADIVLGSDGNDYVCYVPHTSASETQPVTGAKWYTKWRRKDRANTGGSGAAWQTGTAYTAGTGTCKGTLAACREKSNSRRFGGFIGLNNEGVRLA